MTRAQGKRAQGKRAQGKRAQWKQWVLLGLLAGAVPLAGCRPRMEGTRHVEPEVRDPAQQALPENRPGTGGSGNLTTGGIMTFPGSEGQPRVPGVEQKTFTSVPPTPEGGPTGSARDVSPTPQTQRPTGTSGTTPGESPKAHEGK